MKIAITGHRGLPDDLEGLIDQGVREELSKHSAAAAHERKVPVTVVWPDAVRRD